MPSPLILARMLTLHGRFSSFRITLARASAQYYPHMFDGYPTVVITIGKQLRFANISRVQRVQPLRVDDLIEDLKDGTRLLALLEVLSGEKLVI